MTSAAFISLAEAIKMTSAYRHEKPAFLTAGAAEVLLPIHDTIPRNALDKLLAQPGCKSVRVYYGMKDDKSISAVIVGVDEHDADMVCGDSPVILDSTPRCPPNCSKNSPLNS